jgi:hypothetical protein
MAALPVLLEGIESWVKKNRNISKIEVVETKMLRSVESCTRLDNFKNENM